MSRHGSKVGRAGVDHGGQRPRTAAFVDPCQFERRVNVLRGESGLDFLGLFHMRVEVNNSISSSPSQAGKSEASV
jgi:hypothetical protein